MFPELSEIRKRRVRLGLTQKKLAQISDVSQSMIAKLESRRIDPGYSTVKRIFEALEGFEHEENTCAKDLMNPSVIFAKPNERLKGILKKMKKKNIEQMPVMEKGMVIGSISEDSIVSFLSSYEGKRNLFGLKVREVMADSFPIVREDAPYRLLLELLNYNRAALIGKKGKIIGIVTKADLLKVQ